MKPKRYFASDMSSAIKLVRDDLGPEAIILSNKKVTGGVEIISALDNIDEILRRETYSAEPTVKAKAKLRSLNNDRIAELKDSGLNNPGLTKPEFGAPEQGTSGLRRSTLNNAVSNRASRQHAELPSPANSIAEHRSSVKDRGSKKGRFGSEFIAPLGKEKETMENPGDGRGSISKLGQGSDSKNAAPVAVSRSKSAFDYYHDIADQNSSVQGNESVSDAPGAGELSAVPQSDEIREMRGELIFLRKLVEKHNQVGEKLSGKENDPNTSALSIELVNLGFSPWVVERALFQQSGSKQQDSQNQSSQKQGWFPNFTAKKAGDLRSVLIDLIKNINLMNYDLVDTGGCVILVGPPGAGKTTTLAKLATRRVMEHGPQSVRIISLDSHRIGASQQIKAIGEVLNVEVKIQYDMEFFNQLSCNYSDPSILTLIDTAGMLPQDEYWLKQKNSLKNLPKFVKKMLVIPCSNQFTTLQSVINNFSDIGISGCILTKLDETSSMGESLSAMIQSGLEICYVANGQKIPFDLFQFDREGLLSILEDQVDQACARSGQVAGSLRSGSL